MKGSWKLARVAGIDIHLHWTFGLIVAWFALGHLLAGEAMAALWGIALVFFLFGSVVLHELGHALVARRFGIGTRDITLLPIGGMARLERMPREPRRELAIALAGPAVNAVLAAMILGAMWLGSRAAPPWALLAESDLLAQLLYVNLVMAIFNLLPAFPMDGGRVLRALIAFWKNHADATAIAATVGRVLAVAMGLFGLLFNWMLSVIAVFVYLAGQAEARAAETRALLADVQVGAAMERRFAVLGTNDTVARAAEQMRARLQRDFPVVWGGRLVGMLPRDRLRAALEAGKAAAPVGEVMTKDCLVLDERAPIDEVLDRMEAAECDACPVAGGGELVGVLSREDIDELVLLRRSGAWQRTSRPVPPAGVRALAPR